MRGAIAILLLGAACLPAIGCDRYYDVHVRDPSKVSLELNGKALPPAGTDLVVLEEHLSPDDRKAFEDFAALGADVPPHLLLRLPGGALQLEKQKVSLKDVKAGTESYYIVDDDGKIVGVPDLPPGWEEKKQLRLEHGIGEIGLAGDRIMTFAFKTEIVTETENVERVIRRTYTDTLAYVFAGTFYVVGVLAVIAGATLVAKYDAKEAGWGCIGGGLGAVGLAAGLTVLSWKVPKFTKFKRTVFKRKEGK